MVRRAPKLRAIDLYSGVGGWSLGLRLAGIEVVASYELSGAANETNFKNNLHQAQTVDIRRLAFEDLPANIDIVVGSPPCTQFSFSNRGGSGDLDDGLKDIVQFLTIVDHLRPKAWAMENVPRVAKIVERELLPEGRLHRFAHLGMTTHVVNMEEYGLPQRRKRCIVGNFSFDTLESYRSKLLPRTLGDVVKSLAKDPVVDPIYALTLNRADLRDHVIEAPLNAEETRINRANKVLHPVYNSMPFPDPLKRSVRTITATCTRVSRESIVISPPRRPEEFRRLSIRERACLQGFPITFQFYGASYSEKLRMIGNAIPPAFSFYVANAFLSVRADRLPSITLASAKLSAPSPPPAETPPDRPGSRFPKDRRFRFAIPSLRLKSGVRFELANAFNGDQTDWAVSFYFGNSKSIQSLQLSSSLHDALLRELPPKVAKAIAPHAKALSEFLRDADVAHMQALWSHKGVGRTRAFMLLDELSETGRKIISALAGAEITSQRLVTAAIKAQYKKGTDALPGLAKLSRNSSLILAGLIVGSLTNRQVSTQASLGPKAALR